MEVMAKSLDSRLQRPWRRGYRVFSAQIRFNLANSNTFPQWITAIRARTTVKTLKIFGFLYRIMQYFVQYLCQLYVNYTPKNRLRYRYFGIDYIIYNNVTIRIPS